VWGSVEIELVKRPRKGIGKSGCVREEKRKDECGESDVKTATFPTPNKIWCIYTKYTKMTEK